MDCIPSLIYSGFIRKYLLGKLSNVIIGAGSLVNKDIPSGTVAAGVPCRVVGKFEDYMTKIRVE